MRRWLGVALASVAVLAGAGAAQARAYRPDLTFNFGRTFAVGSEIEGAYDQGGFQMAGAALWTWQERFRFGVELFASDFGNNVSSVTLADTSGPPKEYGTIEHGHLGAWGARWRTDVLGPLLGKAGRSYATFNYGYMRLEHDHVGDVNAELSAVCGSVGVGVERVLTPHHALGLSTSATWMSDDFTRRYMSAVLEWRWHR